MPSTYTTSLSLTLPATGELSGTWGTTVNTGITSLVDDSVAGTTTITMVAADYTLTSTQGATNEARRMFLTMTGTPGAARNVIVPAVSKLYFVYNNTTGGFAQTVKTAAGSGISVPNGARMVLYCNGTDVVQALNTFQSPALTSATLTSATLVTSALGTPTSGTLTNCTGLSLTSGVTGTLGGANGGTGTTSFGATGRIPYASSTTALTNSTNLSFASNTLTVNGIDISVRAAADNTVIGYQAFPSNIAAGTKNVVIGYQASLTGTTAVNNTIIGYQAGYSLSSGNNNVIIGTSAYTSGNGFQNVFIGVNASNSGGTCGNCISIGYNSTNSGSGTTGEIVVGPAITGKGDYTAYIGGTSGAYNQKNVTTWETTSDIRIKKNVIDNAQGLDILKQIRIRNFEYRSKEEITELPEHSAVDKPGVQLGVIAQEFQQVLPECVTENSTGVLSVNTDPLVWYLINAIKELSAEIEALKAKV